MQHGRRSWTRGLIGLVPLGLVGLSLTISCDEVPQFEAQGTRTATITVRNARSVLVDSHVAVEIAGAPLQPEIHANLDFGVFADTASQATELAEQVEIVPVQEDDLIQLIVAPPEGTRLMKGLLSLEMPSVLALEVISRTSLVEVRGVERAIKAAAPNGVSVIGARDSVSIEVSNGPAVLDTILPTGSVSEIRVSTGDIELRLPEPVSVTIEAAATGGQVLVSHPGLPQPRSQSTSTYQTSVNGGLAVVRALTGAGRIFIVQR